MQTLRLTLLLVLFAVLVHAQDRSFHGQLQFSPESDILNEKFKAFQIYKIDASPISDYLQSNPKQIRFTLDLGTEHHWDVLLAPNDMRAKNYQLNKKTTIGIISEAPSPNKAFNGYVQGTGGGTTALTVDHNFLYGFVQSNKEVYFIEPLRFLVDGAADDLFLVYAKSDVIPNDNHRCGADDLEENKLRMQQKKEGLIKEETDGLEKTILACYDLELAIASDFSMYTKYGSTVAGVENHTIGVINNVQTNYDNEFTHNVNFVIVTQFVSTCNTCDPWTNSTDAGTLLNSFRSWGNGGGFGPGITYDLAEHWTNRNFDGGTVGIAFVGVLCGNSRYHCIQDYSSEAWALRVVTSHEIGHNLDADHDAPNSGFIMAPSVNNTNIWSAASIASINAHVQSRINTGCLQLCGSGAPPVANFTSNIQEGCASLTVTFDDNSIGATGWFWTFEGGTPATSTAQNPMVVYNNKGDFDVTLEVSNAFGDATLTETDFIIVQDVPEVGFTHSSTELDASFTNSTIDGDTYFWDFGDGATSTAVNPVHTFPEDGEYVVTLTAFNECGESMTTEIVVIVTIPFALFSSDVTIGCIPLTVQFFNQSSTNVTSWNWSFPGGSPSNSNDPNPVVTYTAAGLYDVELTVGNAAGIDTYSEAGFIEVVPDPTAGFTYTVTGNSTVNFNNTSTNATSYLWDFGDGNTSTAVNPVHTYVASGSYNVTLISTNICDEPSVTTTIVITLPVAPTALFEGNDLSGCATHVVQFTNLSLNATSWNWSFPGGSPATSTIQNPLVSYANAGTFNVSLIVGNSIGADTLTLPNYITVDDVPAAGFTSSATGGTVNFSNSSTNADSYAWNFGDGNTSTATNPSHVYTAPGTYTVQLTATNDCGNDVVTQTITIVLPPIAAFTANVTEGCADLTVNFTDQSANGATSWAWVFNGGVPASSTAQNPTVVYPNAGVYTVALTVTNAAGTNTLTQTAYIEVTDVPVAGFSSTVNGMQATFNNSSTNATSYSWNFGDSNTSTATNPQHTYAADGSYTVILTATNACGSVTTTQTVVITNAPTAAFTSNVTTGCADLTVNFTSQSSPNTVSWAWTFEGGSPATSTAQNPTVVFANAGSYDVTLTVTNATGLTGTITQSNYVVVNDVPVAGFSSTVNGMQATFNNSSTNATSYSWNFGNGNTSTATNPQHTYAMDGTYTVTLTATNACGAVTTTQTVVITNAPTAAFTSNVTTGCADLTVNFTSQSSPNTVSWAWTFEGGSPATSTAQNPTVVFANAGTYDVTLTVTNGTGLTGTITQSNYVVVTDVPVAGFSSSVNGMQATFNNSSTNATSYSWNFGNGNTSTATNPQHTYAVDGTYTVTLTATNACGSVTTTQTVVISNAPTAAFSSNITTGCADLTVNFTNQSSPNTVSWAWTFEGGNPATSTAQNPTVVFANAGTYDVTLTVTNGTGLTGTVTQTNYVVVNDVPVAGFSSSVNGMQATFNNSSTNATSYSWNFGNGNTSTATNPQHTYAMDGTYTVTLTATNTCGSVTTTQTVVISNAPTAAFSSNITTGCADLTVNFTNQSSPNTVSWAWTFEGGSPATSTAQNPTVVFANAGTYDVTLTVTNGAGLTGTVTQSNYVVVTDVPVAGFSSSVNGMQATFNNSSTNATSFSWNFGNGNTSTATNPQHTYATDGTYTVTLTATNACGSVTTTQTVVISNAPTAAFSSNITTGCADLTVNFTNQSSPNTVSWAWTFEGGSPATSTAQNPTVVFTSAGTYDVMLTVTNAAGLTNTVNQANYVIALDTPVAGFSSSVNGTNVNFNNSSTNATTYFWNFGDSNTATAASPSHTYATDGTYTVTLIASNICGSVTTTESITIVTTPFAGFSANTTTGCAPLTVTFTDQSSPNTIEWDWTFGGGTPSTSGQQSPTVTFATPGVYTVSLEASNGAGSNTATQTNYIVVLAAPTADFAATVIGTSVNFNNTSTNATSYSWNFGDGGSSSDTNPTHTYLADGTYTVTLSVSNNCGTVTTTETVVIATNPNAGFSADVTTGCGPLVVNFTDGSSPNTNSWSWTFEGGTPGTTTEQNPTVTFNNPGSYTVTLVAGSAGGNSTFTQSSYINVLAAPSAGFTSNTVGAGSSFNNTTTGGTSYLWDFGDGQTSTMPNPQHTYASDGNYTVTLIASNACGSTTITETVNIITAPTAGFTADVTIGCGPLTVNFSDASSNNTTTWLWTFAGGNPASATVANPVVTYTNPGVYAVSLQASNAAGTNTVSQSSYIVVNAAPTASFTSTQNGATFNFNNTSTNGDTYDWEFGDGAESAMENPSHSYTVSGMYTVTLTVSNDCGTVTSTQQVTVTVSLAPVAAFAADVLSGCTPMMVNFTDQSSANPTAWLWTFEGGNPASSTAQNPQVLYEMPGTYAVTLTATNGVGENTVTQNAFIVVTDAAPLSTFSTSVNAATVSFTNESIGGSNFDWDFGDGTGSNLENPTHSYPEDGTYEVTLVVTNNCGTDITIETIVIATLPSAGFSMNANSGCAPLDLSFTDESSNNTTAWAWTFPGGTPASSTEQNPVVTYNLPGTYDVTLVVTNAQGSDTEVQTSSITIAVAPTAGFTTSGSGLTIDFSNTSTGGNSYEWDFGDGMTSTESDPSYTYASAGAYEVTLIVTNACGTETITQTVTIGGAAPSASFSGTPTTGCLPMTVNFTDQSTGASTWFWTFGGGTPASSTEQNPIVVYNTPGAYEVSLAVSNPFGSNSLTQVGYIEVGEAPEASFTSAANAGTVVFTNTSTGGNSYAWDFGDGNSSTEENPSHTYAANGEYTVTLTVTNDCGAVTSTETITVMVSSTTLPESVSTFLYYPNPTEGAFHVDIEALPTSVLQIGIYDIIGRRMLLEEFDFSSGRLNHRFDLGHLTAGTYVLEVVMEGEVLVRKFVVE